MELEAAKMIGAGLAAIALAGAGVGIGIIFGNYLMDVSLTLPTFSIIFEYALKTKRLVIINNT